MTVALSMMIKGDCSDIHNDGSGQFAGICKKYRELSVEICNKYQNK